MSTAAGQNLFEALRDGLADFRAKVEGEPGRKVAALGGASGTVPDVARASLGAVADGLTWLAGALGRAEDALKVLDAATALVEVAADALEAAAEGVVFGELPERLGLDAAPFRAVEAGAASVPGALDKGRHVLGLVPTPELVAGVRMELEKLLGRRVNPSLPHGGALGELLGRLRKTTT